MANNPSPVRYLSATIDNTAGSILAKADGGAVTYTGAMRSFMGMLETGAIRARAEGGDPTTTEGQLVQAPAAVYLTESELQKMIFIRVGAPNGVIKGHIYNTPLPAMLGGR